MKYTGITHYISLEMCIHFLSCGGRSRLKTKFEKGILKFNADDKIIQCLGSENTEEHEYEILKEKRLLHIFSCVRHSLK